jgi:putative pyruvate formate lyase activating enzyme
MRGCNLCPRRCPVDRERGEKGFCGETAELRIAAASLHRGEEPPITGKGGSGTIFVSGCGLGCVFCQNHQISGGGMGRVVDIGEFSSICLTLQKRGAENINIVTGSHGAPFLVRGIEAARGQGLSVPVLWNSSGYESLETLEIIKDSVDLYLPDLKTLDRDLAARFFHAPDYPEAASMAILKMMDYGDVILRHLVLPGCLDATREVLRWFAEHCRGQARLSLMTQYTPVGNEGPRNFLEPREYDRALGWLEEYGIEDGYYQEPVTDNGWLPDFNRSNPFSSVLSLPVWHWKKGFLAVSDTLTHTGLNLN